MSDFIYYSFVIVGVIMLIKFAWSSVKWAFKVWYYLFALIIIGFVLVTIVLPAAFKFVLY